MMMKIDLYQSKSGSRRYLFVPAGTRPDEISDAAGKEFGSDRPSKSLDLTHGKQYVAVDHDAVIKGIRARGYYVGQTKTEIDES